MSIESLWRRWTAGKTNTQRANSNADNPAPIASPFPARAQTQADARERVEQEFGKFLSSFVSLVADELTAHETRQPAILYHSSDALGMKVAEARFLLDVALQHARGERLIKAFEFPHNSPALVASIEGVSHWLAACYLDAPWYTVPDYDSSVNLRWGQLVEKGKKKKKARSQAHEEMVVMRQGRVVTLRIGPEK